MAEPFYKAIVNKLGSLFRSTEAERVILPETDFLRASTIDHVDVVMPQYPVSMVEIGDIAQFASPVILARFALKNELFRHGMPVLEGKFLVRCLGCGYEYTKNIPDTCEYCGGTKFRDPDEKEKEKLESFLLNTTIGVNKNKQLFLDLLSELEDDLNVYDDLFLILRKKYYINQKTGLIQMSKIKEIRRGDPKSIRMVADKHGTLGGKWWVCPAHRKTVSEKPGRCSICNTKMYDVKYIGTRQGGHIHRGAAVPQAQTYYIEGEILHNSRYQPSILYGFSPVLSLWLEVQTVFAKNKYVYKYYKNERIPKGMVLVPTSNTKSLQTMWDYFLRMTRINPHFIPVMGYENEKGKGTAQFVQFINTLAESDFLAIKQDMERIITAVYGVMGVFRGVGAAGATNQGIEITVTNRAIESIGRTYNIGLFPKLLQEFGVREWNLKIVPPEEKDAEAEERLLLMMTQRAQAMQALGFDIIWEEGEKRFRFKKLPPELNPMLGGAPQGQGPLPQTDEPGPKGYEYSAHEQNYGGQPDIPWMKTEEQDDLEKAGVRMYHSHANFKDGLCHEHSANAGYHIGTGTRSKPEIPKNHAGQPCSEREARMKMKGEQFRQSPESQIPQKEGELPSKKIPLTEEANKLASQIAETDLINQMYGNEYDVTSVESLPNHWKYALSGFDKTKKVYQTKVRPAIIETLTSTAFDVFTHIKDVGMQQNIVNQMVKIANIHFPDKKKLSAEKVFTQNKALYTSMVNKGINMKSLYHGERKGLIQEYAKQNKFAGELPDMVIKDTHNKLYAVSLKEGTPSQMKTTGYVPFLTLTNMSGKKNVESPPDKTSIGIEVERDYEVVKEKVVDVIINAAEKDVEKFNLALRDKVFSHESETDEIIDRPVKTHDFWEWFIKSKQQKDFNVSVIYSVFKEHYPEEAQHIKTLIVNHFNKSMKAIASNPSASRVLIKGMAYNGLAYRAIDEDRRFNIGDLGSGKMISKDDYEKLGITKDGIDELIQTGTLKLTVGNTPSSKNKVILNYNKVPIASMRLSLDGSQTMIKPRLTFSMQKEFVDLLMTGENDDNKMQTIETEEKR